MWPKTKTEPWAALWSWLTVARPGRHCCEWASRHLHSFPTYSAGSWNIFSSLCTGATSARTSSVASTVTLRSTTISFKKSNLIFHTHLTNLQANNTNSKSPILPYWQSEVLCWFESTSVMCPNSNKLVSLS